MVGYIDNKTRTLNEWYYLFKKKHPEFSKKNNNYWEQNIIKFNESYHAINDPWKYFPIEEFYNNQFILNEDAAINLSTYNKLRLNIDCYRLVFINGQFSCTLSDLNINPWILKIDNNLNYWNTSKPIRPTMFLYLTEYLSDVVIRITLPEKKITKKPLYLLYINSGSDTPNALAMSHSYHYLETGQNTDAYVIEHVVNINEYAHFSGSRMLMSIGNKSKFNHVKLILKNQSSYHISHQDMHINSCSDVHSNTFVIAGSKFTYHQISSKINYSESSISLNSLTILSERNISNMRTYIEHNNQNCSISRQLHKIIASDYSTGIFDGLIKVNPHSIKTDGKMINNNLLLNKTASIYTIPKLEIYSDSVQCNHGSTVGHIDLNHLFYLSTRGISKKDAIKMLIDAFTIENIKKIQNLSLQKIIADKIKNVLTKKIIFL
ncbi:required for stability of iron-sulfur component of FhuF [Candidatus Blochmanniella floridana]|uniref:Required for stability of iron-sulfur component of FhuF n=1 Tax=Blochmanniella floridana TaxID=203907 RepID=Q7VR61_BLOFL|nr:required for stability of iron-sulfur component of FhuF [Candidatus Blochmannia floridanus]